MWRGSFRIRLFEMTSYCIVMTGLQYPASHFFNHVHRRADRVLIMLLDVECYQDAWWHPAFLSFSTFYQAALALWAWSVVACGPWRALCKRPSRGPAGPGLLTVPWPCCLSRKTSVGATERLWIKAVWSAERVELEKIRLHPRVIVFPEQARARRPQYC